jgi:hypothetical protein
VLVQLPPAEDGIGAEGVEPCADFSKVDLRDWHAEIIASRIPNGIISAS